MFDNYYDTAELLEYEGLDNFNRPKYNKVPKQKKVRFIKSTTAYDVEKQSMSTTIVKIYHSPEEIPLKSKLNGDVVYECKPVKSILGRIEFYKVWCK